MEVKEINNKELKELVKKNKKVLVDCYAVWCGPCKMLSPIIDQLASEVESTNFYKINVDEDDEISDEYNISSIPTLLYFEDGKLKEQLVGLKSKDELLELIGE